MSGPTGDRDPIRRRRGRLAAVAAVLLALALAAAACGPGQSTDVQSTSGSNEFGAAAADSEGDNGASALALSTSGDDTRTATATFGGLVTDVAGAEGAVIQILATGAFVEPDAGPIEGVGSGSGFFITDDGVAVTNYHVVGGAAILDVFVAGEPEPVRARILGVDECSDLAVIKVDGASYPHLEFAQTHSPVGTEVFLAGFPLGDPQYTLTSGIVSKENAFGDTSWASIDAVIQHGAKSNPGASGGPVINHGGQVVGVNFAGNAETDQNFAITGPDAVPIINRLAAGENVDSLGINGTVLSIGEVHGMWVSSVDTDSPAGRAGIEAGDFITRVEHVDIGVEGTKRRYCEIVRGRGATTPMHVELIRPSTGEVLSGAVNSSEPLSIAFDPGASGDLTVQAGVAPYVEFTTLTDSTGQLSVQVPTAWDQTLTTPYQGQLPMLIASDRIEAMWKNGDFNDDEDDNASGLVLIGIDVPDSGFTPEGMLAEFAAELGTGCDSIGGYEEIEIAGFVGYSQIATDCSAQGLSSVAIVAAEDPSTGRLILLLVPLLTDADVQYLPTILASIDFR
ncbi:MAG: S1C family serine protease [Actinomycetota bacterium]